MTALHANLPDLSDAARSEVFPYPAVREVSCEIRFSPRLRIQPEVWRIQEKLAATHPQVAEEKTFLAEGRVLPSFVFVSADGTSLVRVSQENFAVITQAYRTFESFRDEALGWIRDFCSEFQIAAFTRIGLRYVNHIDLHSLQDLNRYLRTAIDPERIAWDNVEQFLTEFRFRAGQHRLTCRGAMLPTDSDLVYILDIDCYDNNVHELSEVADLLETFHGEIQGQFLSHLTEDYKNVMRGKR